MTGLPPQGPPDPQCPGRFAAVGQLFGLRAWVCDTCQHLYTRQRPRPAPPTH